MGNLFTSLTTASDSMRTFERALSVTGNNVANAGTPGFARQRANLVAKPLRLDEGLPGGVSIEGLISARDRFLEQGVWRQAHRAGTANQQTELLRRLEPVFDISEGAGVAGAIDSLARAVSQWTVTPNDFPARENVVRRAADLALAFRSTAEAIGAAGQNADAALQSVVSAINRLGSLLHALNQEVRGDIRKGQDPGLDAQVHQALEELSEHIDFTVLRGDDGGFSVFIGGQTPLALGDNFYPISAEVTSGAAVIRDAEGRDITNQIQQGRLRGILDYRNTLLPAVAADLDLLAATLAGRVNGVLAAGVDSAGLPPAIDLFAYDPLAGAAATLSVTAIAPGELAAADPASPGGNANALALAQLFESREVNDFTFTQYVGQIAGGVGRALRAAEEEQQTQGRLVSQAQALRAEAIGVSLNEEAAQLIAFQRAYQASAQMVRTLNEMTEEVIQLLR